VNHVGYNAAYPVTASWALEFAPVALAVVMAQCNGNEWYAIASRVWHFEELARCVAEVRELYPWRISEHVLPYENEPRVWEAVFQDQRLNNLERSQELPDGKRMMLTQRFLSRLHIDTQVRPWAEHGNNEDLVDALNGFRVKEMASQPDVFTVNALSSHEQYLARAVEHLAVWDWVTGSTEQWSKPLDYTKHDRAVI
jgi:hypothetical protein